MAEGRDTGLPLRGGLGPGSYKFWRKRATAIAKIPDGAVKPCWHDESITGTWCSLANLLNPSMPTQATT